MNKTKMRDEIVELGGAAHALAFQVLGNGDDAADAVQDAMLTVLRKPRAYDPSKGELKPWFFRVVRNRALDLLRQRRPVGTDVEQLRDERADPDRAAEQAESDHALWQALMRLSADHREIIVMRDYLGLSYAEIGAVAGIEAGTVMSRIHRARVQLRTLLSEDGG
jgi:RNA polymerase sigma-70 factor (ECF subfamily)